MDDQRRWSTEGGKATGPLRKSPMLMRAGGDDSAVLTVFSRTSQQNLAGIPCSVRVMEPGSDLQAPLLQAEDSSVQSKLDFACELHLLLILHMPVLLAFWFW
jgi:hypothetical protein